MGLFKKLGRGIKKFSSFSGKVIKSAASGNPLQVAGTIASNLGGSRKKASPVLQQAQMASGFSVSAGGYSIETPEEKARKRNMWLMIGGGVLVVITALLLIFKRKR